MQIWCNQQWSDLENAPPAPLDRGSILGLGLFETLLALDGKPVFLERHLARLRSACARLNWEISFPEFSEIIAELLVKNQLTAGRAKLRITVTAGSGPLDDLRLGNDSKIWVTAQPPSVTPASVTAVISPWPRNEHSPLAGLKCASYAENLLALDHARCLGFAETLFLNTAGHLCEAATANLFLVKNGALFTPSLASGCLPGIAREIVLELAMHHDLEARQCILTREDLENADEVFTTSSIRGVQRISKIAEQVFHASTLTSQLREYWTALSIQPIKLGCFNAATRRLGPFPIDQQ